MEKILVESINYQISNCVVELLLGALFGVFSILALLSILPLDAVMFFLIPCVFIIGWCFVKFHTTPEVLTLTSESLEYRRGRKFIFKEKVSEIKKISLDEGEVQQLFYDKFFIIYYGNGSERSFPYRHLSHQQIKSVSDFLIS